MMTLGIGLILVGAAGFVVASFLPYFDPDVGESLSLWGFYTVESSAGVTISAVLILFSGPAALIGISLVGLLRSRPSTVAALIAASLGCCLLCACILLNAFTRTNTEMAVAYWLMLLFVAAVFAGATMLYVSMREARSSEG